MVPDAPHGTPTTVEDAAAAAVSLPEAATLPLAAFTRAFLAGVDHRDLARRSADEWARTAAVAAAAAATCPPGVAVVRVTEAIGSSPARTFVDLVVDDMPFLVDSVTMEVSRRGLAIHQAIHPLLRVVRTDDQLVEVERRGSHAGAPAAGQRDEALVHLEIDALHDEEDRRSLAAGIADVVEDVRLAVEDYPAMRTRLHELIDALAGPHPDHEAEYLAEVRRFLGWLDEDHFTFLGFQRYVLDRHDGEVGAVAEAGAGLGLLRDGARRAEELAALPGAGHPAARDHGPLTLTKADARSTVHRPVYLDHVEVTVEDDDGHPVAAWRFLGLYTSRVYDGSVREIPVVRRTIDHVVDRADLAPDGHSAKELVAILEEYPRDELFEISAGELEELAHGLLGLQERREVRLFVRMDRFGRYVSCLLFVPRDRYDTATRLRLQAVLTEVFDARDVDHEVHISASVLARVRFVVRVPAGASLDVDVRDLERRLAAVTRTWEDDLLVALEARHPAAEAARIAARHRDTFPTSYKELHDPEEALADLAELDGLDAGGLGMRLHWRHGDGLLPRFKVFRAGEAIPLSRMLPMLEHMGFEVVDRQPHALTPTGVEPVWLYDFQLRIDLPGALDHEGAGALFQEAFARVWAGDAEDDGLNRLVVWARLGWRDVEVLRAYLRYVRQTDSRYSQAYMEDALVGHPEIARRLVALFHARFDPDHHDQESADALRAEIESRLEDVPSLDEDRILRGVLAIVLATVRTSAFQGADGERAEYLVLKFDPSLVPELPRPLPAHEVFVYATRTEGIHLRGGPVARGGIRWSDRREDFRTEVLGLAKAQAIKNAVIVPVGAKGAFVLKQPPAPDAARDAVFAEVAVCYRIFIRGLLAVTDNLVDGVAVPPERVVRYDGDDPYLVVAADRGTATFSDTANQLAEERGFWLGDAFASGGSAGYDHKDMGITARGAWESVRRHFRELGVDVQTQPVDVVGIGDLSGDVFGNGMLRSDRLRLVAAFDHRHVFLDPDPDPEESFAERHRMFALPRSSWDDYDRQRISEGGGVWPRTAKSVPLAPAVRQCLGVDEDELAPEELIAAILRAPVDLLYNGGVGTFVKASDERHLDVGDRVNDRIRVDAAQLRAKVVAEGGNLGFTQRARVEFARAGGRINIDAIDNSGGVDTSDREVNIKILLTEPMAAGELTRGARDALLASLTEDVAALVLAGNADQALALSSSVANARSMADVLRRYLVHLEQAGALDRALEGLPSDEELAERQALGEGLVRPEFAVLLAATKTVVTDELLAADLPDDPGTDGELAEYFPAPLPTRFPAAMRNHRLRREIVATRLANQVVNEAGVTFVFRLQQETGATVSDIVRAQLIARAVFGLEELQRAVRALDDLVRADVQTDLLLEARRLVERTSRWLLRNVARPADLVSTTERFAAGVDELTTLLPASVRGLQRSAAEERQQQLEDRGVPADLAARAASYPVLASALELVQVGERTGEPLPAVVGVTVELDRQLELDWLRKRIEALARDRRWDALARDALREEFAAEHAAMTTLALGATDVAAPPRQRAGEWLDRHEVEAQRCRQVLREIRASSAADLAMLSVGLRELRNLVHAAG